ncbi:hypothetical protein QBC33DRAFT_623993 [Phialemonium atrogriseum]|uniref:Uncharacterized protein n=1 Tax=Phialemonium atrogriseum TaxID=1093897 RepID=A0AAJ0FG54_9PEZI|nr:uncharacterized protein QBC33DRAFT_623993 [Phialemonium atrogriseum]KAK1762043.1 hypothetical protein QBC33DRAFT_623993 [Phialemonium atrogriseum]
MKSVITNLLAATGLFAVTLANPMVSKQLTKRCNCNFDEIFAQVEAHAEAAVSICTSADIDVDAALESRAAVAAKLQADLEAAAELLAQASADLEAATSADVEASNSGCDSSCIKKTITEHSETFCDHVSVIVETLGEDCVKPYVKPCMANFGAFAKSCDKLFAGVAASVGGVVQAVLGASLSLSLGLDIGAILGIGLGGILGIGRA